MKPTTFKEEYCQMLMDHMNNGMSYESFGAVVNKGRSTLYDWEKSHETWREAKEVAIEKALSFFEKRLIDKVSGNTKVLEAQGIKIKDIDTSCLVFALKTRMHKIYSEKTEVEVSGSVSINIDSDDMAV